MLNSVCVVSIGSIKSNMIRQTCSRCGVASTLTPEDHVRFREGCRPVCDERVRLVVDGIRIGQRIDPCFRQCSRNKAQTKNR